MWPPKPKPHRKSAPQAPSPDGGYGGWVDPWAERSPSTNGGNGSGALETFVGWLRELRAARGGNSRT